MPDIVVYLGKHIYGAIRDYVVSVENDTKRYIYRFSRA